jgi:hypothetical protein
MQELCRRGVLAPSFVVSYAHGDAEIDATIEAARGRCVSTGRRWRTVPSTCSSDRP